jgi:adenylate cyclase
LTTLLGNFLPHRPSWVPKAEIFGAMGLGVVAIAIVIFHRPLAATALVGLLCLTWPAAAVAAFAWKQTLTDMAGPPLVAVVVFAVTILGSYAQNERLVRALRRRFEQHLAPDVVQRQHAPP